MSKIILEFSHEEVDWVVGDLQKLATVQTMDQIRDNVAKEFSNRIEVMKQQIEELNNPVPKKHGNKLNGRWSRKYDARIICHQSDKKHMGKGLCTTCYFLKKDRKTIIPLDVRSDGVKTAPTRMGVER